jgi:hypothetical protein
VALTASIFLRMDRPDQAANQLRLMQQTDEDATLTQLVAAWVHLYKVRQGRLVFVGRQAR